MKVKVATTKMAFMWRRRSSLLKIVVITMAIWCMVALVFYSEGNRRDSQAGSGQDNDAIPMALKRDYDSMGQRDIKVNKRHDGSNNEIGDEEGDMPVISNEDEEVVKEKKRPQRQRWRKNKPDKGGDQKDGHHVVLPPENLDAPGEMGKAVVLPTNMTAEMKKLVDEGWLNNAFNQYASDLISVHRSLPDPRDEWCKAPDRFEKDLPATSVIICFHNEAWSVLLRTVHSVLDRSPEELIEEIILVDDYSDMPHVKQQLDDYFKAYPKVKILRAKKREGLIRARLLGAKVAKGPVLLYLDSHCECAPGWLEPLLDRIAKDPTNVVCPVIDVISDDTLEFFFRDSTGVNVGGFDWNLQFNWHAVPDREKKRHKNPAEAVHSPTMAGGLFAIDKAFFEKLGLYDSGFDIWGGENLELSFKTWMCGGTLEIVPCSHVGHIFRKRSPYKWRSGVNVLKRNSIRLAEVWLDDYAKYYYQRIGNDKGDFGDISERVELRNELQCKSFKWYLDTVYPELFIPGEAMAHGEIRNLGYGGRTCLDSPSAKRNLKKAVGLYPCHNQGGNQMANVGDNPVCLDSSIEPQDMQKPIKLWPCHRMGGNQFWMLSREGEIRRDEACLDYSGGDVVLFPCHGSKGNQFWTYNKKTQQLRHGSSEKCLAINKAKNQPIMEECDAQKDRQKWKLENYDPSKALNRKVMGW